MLSIPPGKKKRRLQVTIMIILLLILGRIYSINANYRAEQMHETNNLKPRGVLGILSDGDDRRIFLGLKFSSPGFFWVRKFGKYFLG